MGEGVDGGDAVTKHQMEVGLSTKPDPTEVLLLDGRNHMTGDLDLRGNKIILPGGVDMDRKLITNLDTDPNQDLSAVNMTTLKTNIGSKADKNYVDFEITKQNALINGAFVKKTGDVLTGDLILPHDSYPVQGNTNKAVSYETQREIFLSRKESFPMQADINMNNNFIQNVATPTTSHQGANKGYCDYNFLNRQKGGRIMGSLSMNQNDLFEIPAPKYGSSAVNKNYVDAKIPVDSTQFVKKVGDQMSGDLDMGSHFVKNVGINLSDDSTVVPRSYVDSFANSAISNPSTADLNAGDFQIKQLKTPTEDKDAINKKYFEDELLKSHLIPSHRENAFKYLLDQDESSSENNIRVNGVVDFNGSAHKNKKAYSVDFIKDSDGSNDYRSRIIDLSSSYWFLHNHHGILLAGKHKYSIDLSSHHCMGKKTNFQRIFFLFKNSCAIQSNIKRHSRLFVFQYPWKSDGFKPPRLFNLLWNKRLGGFSSTTNL